MTYSYTTSVNLGASKNKPGHTREHVTVTFLSIVHGTMNILISFGNTVVAVSQGNK